MINRQSIALMILSLVFSFGGCGKGQPPQKPMAAKVQPSGMKEGNKEPEVVKPVAPEEYKYDSRGRRDPFYSLLEITKKKPLKKKGASPFESYEVDEVRLLAIASNNNKHYALIILPDKKTYTITEGMLLGLQGGKIEKITKDQVIIREFIQDYRGEIKPRDSILKLHKGEEE
jgi:Tfp pilus assembly protein PilP